ncbi:MAG TPA: YciI family protein [Roseiarcus sp.]|nr:YciI family protein [Roseiarcus sp.]
MSDSQFFLCRLIPPRPNFATTMSADEREIMQAHVGCWNGQLQLGNAIAFGPVADPRGDWGVGIVAAPDERTVQGLRDADPTILSRRGFRYEILPMPSLMTRS